MSNIIAKWQLLWQTIEMEMLLLCIYSANAVLKTTAFSFRDKKESCKVVFMNTVDFAVSSCLCKYLNCNRHSTMKATVNGNGFLK